MTGLILAAAVSAVNASDITLSKAIPSGLRSKIEKDLTVIENFKFKADTNDLILKVMGLSVLNSQTASDWLNQRVNYIISENALSPLNLFVHRTVYVDRKDVDFPNPQAIPYSTDFTSPVSPLVPTNTLEDTKSFKVMSNIGAALYMGGKNSKEVFGMKISRGFLRKSELVSVISPRTGIIQIGEGLFAPELTINKDNADALVNSIFRLATFFHEARHSDGNGKSLGFGHSICPKGHNYAGQPACDENLNGPYTVGALMLVEMARSCDNNCSDKEKEILKMLILDDASRIIKTTHKGEVSTNWDATPETL